MENVLLLIACIPVNFTSSSLHASESRLRFLRFRTTYLGLKKCRRDFVALSTIIPVVSLGIASLVAHFCVACSVWHLKSWACLTLSLIMPLTIDAFGPSRTMEVASLRCLNLLSGFENAPTYLMFKSCSPGVLTVSCEVTCWDGYEPELQSQLGSRRGVHICLSQHIFSFPQLPFATDLMCALDHSSDALALAQVLERRQKYAYNDVC